MSLNTDDNATFQECWRILTELSQESERIGKELHDRLIIAWTKEIGGLQMQRLLASRENALAALIDADAARRCVALCVLAHCWEHDEHLTHLCEQAALIDPDESVRANAVYCLGVIVKPVPDLRIAHVLATIVCDEAQPIKVRETAYDALFWLRIKVNPEQSPDYVERSLDKIEQHNKERGAEFRDRVDWHIVDYFFRDEKVIVSTGATKRISRTNLHGSDDVGARNSKII